jgi:hypothetical protein
MSDVIGPGDLCSRAATLTIRIPGNTFWMQVTILSSSTFVGLNPQEPVASQTIIDSFLGLIIGMGIATLVGRLIWPVLPQRLLRDDLLGILSQIKALLGGDPHREKIQTLLAILPVEALQVVRQIRMSGCSEGERATLQALVRALQALVTQTTELVYRRHLLPEITAPILRPEFERLEIEFGQILDVLAECFRRGDCRRKFPSLRGALAAVDQAVEKIRVSRILSNQSLEAPVRTLDLVDRYHATGEALEECGRLARTLEIQRYLGGLRAISGQLGKRYRLISDHKVNGGGPVHSHAGFFSNRRAPKSRGSSPGCRRRRGTFPVGAA